MSIITLARGGKTIDASPQAAESLRRQGWTEVADVGPVAVVVPRPVAVATPKPKRRARK